MSSKIKHPDIKATTIKAAGIQAAGIQAAKHTQSFYKGMIHKLGHVVFSRFSLLLISLTILILSSEVLRHLYAWMLTPEDDVESMLSEVEGISSIFLGFGLILKERQLLEKIFGSGPGHENRLNQLCVHAGLCLILNATAMGLAARLIHIPERLISTDGKEQYIFAVGLVFCAIASMVLIYLAVQLALDVWRERRLKAKSAGRGPQSRSSDEP